MPESRAVKPAPIANSPSAAARPAALGKGEVVFMALLFAAFAVLHLAVAHPFHRPLIDLDDRAFVGALHGVSLADYFSTFMWRPNALAFPVRDLTFMLDERLSSALGVQTYVATSVLLFLAYACLVHRWLRRTIPIPAALLILSIVVMHPANVEIVQWAISRKHLLVGLFSICGVLLVGRMRDADRPARALDFAALFGLCALSLLSHPTGVLFPLWAVVMLFPKCRAQKAWTPLALFTAATLLLSALWLRQVTEHNNDYRGLIEQSGFAVEEWGEKVRYLLLGLGRATWQLLLPYQQAIYFSIESFKNKAGLALLLAGLSVLCWLILKARKQPGARGSLRHGLDSLLLAALLFAPEAAFVARRTDFVMADRFLFASLPFLLAGIYQVTRAASPAWTARLSPKTAALTSAALVALYLIPAASAAPRWNSEKELYRDCVQIEGSDRCYFHHVSKLLESGCAAVAREYGPLLAELRRAVHNPRSLYRSEGGLVLSFCSATVLGQTPAARGLELDKLKAQGATDQSMAFARNLLSVEEAKPLDALFRTTDLFLAKEVDSTKMSQAMLGVMLGQMQALSLLEQLQQKGVGPALATLQARYAEVQIAPEAIALGRNATLSAMVKGKLLEPLPQGRQ